MGRGKEVSEENPMAVALPDSSWALTGARGGELVSLVSQVLQWIEEVTEVHEGVLDKFPSGRSQHTLSGEEFIRPGSN